MVHALSAPLAAVASAPGTLTGSCGDKPGIACRLAWDLSHSTSVAQVVQVYLAGPVGRGGRIVFIIVVALVIRVGTLAGAAGVVCARTTPPRPRRPLPRGGAPVVHEPHERMQPTSNSNLPMRVAAPV